MGWRLGKRAQRHVFEVPSHITAKLTLLMQEFGVSVLAQLVAQVYLFEKL